MDLKHLSLRNMQKKQTKKTNKNQGQILLHSTGIGNSLVIDTSLFDFLYFHS